MPSRSFFPSFVVATLSAAVGAQSQWERTTTGPTPPAARFEHALAEDFDRREVVLFGGRDPNGVLLADTWTWNGSTWTRRSPTWSPPARRNAAFAWHHIGRRVVLYGGVDAQGLALDDLWEWDGNDWAQVVQASPRPSARAGAALASGTADGALVLFGGIDALGVPLADTWLWDGAQWQLATPSIAPSARFGHRLAGDAVRERLVLYGGFGASADTWLWDGGAWTLVAQSSLPGLRMRHAMTWDAARARVVLHGGTDGLVYARNDTFEFDGVAWELRTTALLPAAVVDAALAFDAARERTIRFGGFDGFGASDETWSFGAVRPAIAREFGAGCMGSAGIPRLAARGWDRPWLGDTFFQVADRVPVTAPMALHVGFSRTTWAGQSLPFALDFMGMTGCSLFASIDAIGVVHAVAGTGSLPLTVPWSPPLVGASIYAQALVIDPLANLAGVTASNAVEFTIGVR